MAKPKTDRSALKTSRLSLRLSNADYTALYHAYRADPAPCRSLGAWVLRSALAAAENQAVLQRMEALGWVQLPAQSHIDPATEAGVVRSLPWTGAKPPKSTGV